MTKEKAVVPTLQEGYIIGDPKQVKKQIFDKLQQTPPVNGPVKDRTGDEEEQTEMVWTCA